MKTKQLLRDMCRILFNAENKIICKVESSEDYLCMVTNKTLNAFFNDDNRTAPTKKICDYVLELCRYYLYPNEYKNNDEYRDNDKIIEFSCKVIFFLMAVCKHNYSMLRVDNAYGNIDNDKKEILYLVLKNFLKTMEKEEVFDNKQFQCYLDKIIGCYSSSPEQFITEKPTPYYTREEIQEYFSISAKSFERLKDYGENCTQKLKKSADRYLELIERYINLTKSLYECSFIYELEETYKKYKEDNPLNDIYPAFIFDKKNDVNKMRVNILNHIAQRSYLSYSVINESYIDYANSTGNYIAAFMKLKVLLDRFQSVYKVCERKMNTEHIQCFSQPISLLDTIYKTLNYLNFQNRVFMNLSID